MIKWSILKPATGSGKTVGLEVYLALLANALQRLPKGVEKPGALVVCRTTDQCDDMVRNINQLAGVGGDDDPVAVTRHSNLPRRISVKATAEFPILIITHEALVRTADPTAEGGENEVYVEFFAWNGGRRCLTVIDEALNNVIKHHTVTKQDLHHVLSVLPAEIEAKRVSSVGTIKEMIGYIEGLERPTETAETVMLWKSVFDRPTDPSNLYGLIDDLRGLAVTEDPIGQRSKAAMRGNIQKAVKVCEELVGLLETAFYHPGRCAAYRAKMGLNDTLNNGIYLLPPDEPGPVLLDATASQNSVVALWDKDTYEIISVRQPRRYQNVTLHIARIAKGIGKTAMVQHRDRRASQLHAFLDQVSEPGDQWFVVSHKDVEPIIIKERTDPETCVYSVEFAHWGAVDGKNDWSDCNKAVLYGLSYRTPVWANNIMMAMNGPDAVEEFQSQANEEMRRELEVKNLATGIIQAANRIRCRKVTDADGNCPAADIYIMLPANKVGDTLEAAIKEEMPGINVVPWGFHPDDQQQRSSVKAPDGVSQAVLEHMRGAFQGQHFVEDVRQDLGLDKSEKANLMRYLRDEKRPLLGDLRGLGVEFVPGRGRYAKSYFLKQAS